MLADLLPVVNEKVLERTVQRARERGIICPAGEVAASVFDRYRSDTYREAGHKPYVMAAMILLTRFADPAARLRECLASGRRRR